MFAMSKCAFPKSAQGLEIFAGLRCISMWGIHLSELSAAGKAVERDIRRCCFTPAFFERGHRDVVGAISRHSGDVGC